MKPERKPGNFYATAWGETIVITPADQKSTITVNPGGNSNAGIPSHDDRKNADFVVWACNAAPDLLEVVRYYLNKYDSACIPGNAKSDMYMRMKTAFDKANGRHWYYMDENNQYQRLPEDRVAEAQRYNENLQNVLNQDVTIEEGKQ
jgi:hypothetical protein